MSDEQFVKLAHKLTAHPFLNLLNYKKRYFRSIILGRSQTYRAPVMPQIAMGSLLIEICFRTRVKVTAWRSMVTPFGGCYNYNILAQFYDKISVR